MSLESQIHEVHCVKHSIFRTFIEVMVMLPTVIFDNCEIALRFNGCGGAKTNYGVKYETRFKINMR